MKKLLFILFSLNLSMALEANVLHIRKDKLKELNKDFRESINFLKTKQQQIIEERSDKLASYQVKFEEFKNKKNPSQKEKDEIEKLESEVQSLILFQNEELYKAALVFDEKINSDIKDSLKKIVEAPVIEGQLVLYGGTDITKELLEALNNKDVKKISTSFNSKIYSFDIEKFNAKCKGAKDIRKYIDQKLEEIKSKKREFKSKIDSKDKDFNQEEAEKNIKAMQNELQTTNQVMQEKLLSDVERALSRIATSKKVDLVVTNRLIYSSASDITEEVIKELEKNEENTKEVKKNNNPLVGFVNYETIMTKYRKQDEKRKEIEEKSIEFEKALEEKSNQIQKFKDNNKSDSKKAEIERMENEFDQIRSVKSQQLQQLIKSVEDEILNDIKTASKIVGNKKKLELILFKSKGTNAVLYADHDVTQDVLNILENK